MSKVDFVTQEYRKHMLSMINELVSLMSDGRKAELRAFIFSYKHCKSENISFCLRKDHMGQSFDANSEFRDDLAYFILSNCCSLIPSDLLRDIYIESAKCSEVLNGSPEYIPFIVELLIKQTGKKFIEDICFYLNASFDFYGACISIDLHDYNVSPLIQEITDLMMKCKSDEEYKKLENGLEFFLRFN
jgi:hypothetical protein